LALQLPIIFLNFYSYTWQAVLKLQKKGAGAPSREAPVDAETQKAMMAWYYKKQEEQKVSKGFAGKVQQQCRIK
jgi:hypothetical protein